MMDWDNPQDVHRHVSHLYGLFPSNQISPYRTPELFDAARTSLIHRGDPSTGWSMGWKVCLWARLLDGDHAYKLITDQLTLVRNEKKKEELILICLMPIHLFRLTVIWLYGGYRRNADAEPRWFYLFTSRIAGAMERGKRERDYSPWRF